ncbi:MAG: hypothetical protein ACJA2X_000713 [Halocynthiibacter sp.]
MADLGGGIGRDLRSALAVLWLFFCCVLAGWRLGLAALRRRKGNYSSRSQFSRQAMFSLIYMLCFAGFATLQIGPFSRFVRAMFSFFGALYVAGRMA